MTDRKFGLLAAVRALRYAMSREGLTTEGLAIVLPDDAFRHSESLLVRDLSAYFALQQPVAEPGMKLLGVRILPASDVAIRD